MLRPLALLVQLAAADTGAVCTAAATAPALDHAVVAVRDLDRAEASFRRLGFRIKSGRLHPNGLLNRHVKFRDGSSVELMTVRGEPRDEMAREYARLLADGEGGVYVALVVSSLDPVRRAAAAAGLATRESGSGPWRFLSFPAASPAAAVFFGAGDFRVQDPDSVLSHAPPVTGLAEGWIEGGAELGALLRALGAGWCGHERAPDGRVAERWRLARGDLVVVPPRARSRPRVPGVVLATPDSAAGTLFPLRDFWIRFRPAR